MTDTIAAPEKRSMTLVVLASSMGTMFEWYDFFIFGSLAAIIAKHFFAGVSDAQAYLFALLTFAAGFFARPFGAVVFGRAGDIVGRKRTFLITISVMGLATFAVAVLPDYAQIGIVAPIALVAIRIMQGFAIGGEYGGAAIYVAEHSGAKRRGVSTGWIQAAAGMGLILALAVILLTRKSIGEETFAAWGWRIPFAASFLLLAISLWIRLRLHESPMFQRMRDEGKASKAPLSEAFLNPANLKIVLVVLIGVLTTQGVVWYTAQFYTQFFLERILKVEPAVMNELIMAVTLASIPIYMFFAWLSDIIGRKPVMLFGIFLSLGFLPAFQMLTVAANPALAAASKDTPVVVAADPAHCSVQFDLIGKAKFVTACDIAKSALTSTGISYTTVSAPSGAEVRVGSTAVTAPDGTGLDKTQLTAATKDFGTRLKAALTAAGYPASADTNKIDFPRTLLILMFFIVSSAALYAPQAAALVELFPTRIRYTALSVPYHVGVGWFGGFLPPIAFAVVAATGNIYAGLWYPTIVSAIGFIITLFFVPETKGRAIE